MDAFDQLLLRGEANPRSRSGMIGLEILDRVPDWDRFLACFDRASRVVPRLRQKVITPVVPTAQPRWVIDPDFNLTYHVRRTHVPQPGTFRAAMDLAEIMLQSPLDVARPLWTVTLVEGLEEGHAAVLSHMSHAVTDGVGGMEMFAQLYDAERDPKPRRLAPAPIPQDLSSTELTLSGLNDLPGVVVGGLRGVVSGVLSAAGHVVTDPNSAVSGVINYVRSAYRMMAPVADTSPLLRRRSLATRSEAIDIDFADLRAAAKAGGGSLNDAYLAGVCAALRRYHDAMEVPITTLPMAVPVNLRVADDPAAGNRFAGVTLMAPIGELDPASRIQDIRSQMRSRRNEPAIGMLGAVAPALALLPQPLVDALTESISVPDVQASNVPGYTGDTYLAGAKVVRQYGLGPLPGVAMMSVMVSRAGICTVTVRYDRASVTDSALFAQCLQSGFDEVLALAGPSSRGAIPVSSAPTLGAREQAPPS